MTINNVTSYTKCNLSLSIVVKLLVLIISLNVVFIEMLDKFITYSVSVQDFVSNLTCHAD